MSVSNTTHLLKIPLIFFYYLIISILFEVLFFLISPFLALKHRSLRMVIRLNIWHYSRWIVRSFRPMMKVEVVNTGRIAPGQQAVYASNHRSFVDVFLGSRFVPQDVNVFVRAWPFRIPMLNWFMKPAGYINVERTPWEEVLDKVSRDIQRGSSLLVFPEGHRSRDGKLLPFKPGAFVVASHCKLPVIPVVVTGTEGFSEKAIPFLRPIKVRIELLEPVDPKEDSSERRAGQNLRREVERIYLEKLSELSKSAT